MILGYNTNGFAFHRLHDAIAVLAELGYRSVAVTLDHHHLDPFGADIKAATRHVRSQLREHAMACTIETGARFLLDPRRKHQPTLISKDADARDRRVDLIAKAIEIAAELDADCVSLWSGRHDDAANNGELLDRLESSMCRVLTVAETHDMRIAFEPEPDMYVDTMQRFAQLYERLDHPLLGLTLDVGHVHCLDDGNLLDHLQRWQNVLWNVHLEDMRRGKHVHLFFGEGEINFCETIDFLSAVAYKGAVHVELSGHSANAVETARRAYEFLSPLGLM